MQSMNHPACDTVGKQNEPRKMVHVRRRAPQGDLSGVGFLQTGMGSGLVPVGAGVVRGRVGTLVVARVLPSRGTRATPRVPPPPPNLSRPYGDDGLPPKNLPLKAQGDAPIGADVRARAPARGCPYSTRKRLSSRIV